MRFSSLLFALPLLGSVFAAPAPATFAETGLTLEKEMKFFSHPFDGYTLVALNHAQVLLSLIHSFPTTNPTPTPIPSQPNNTGTDEPKAEADLDLANLISNIRARYKLLCSSLNVKPRLQVAQIVEVDPRSGAGASGVEAGSDGPAKGVDTTQLRF
ncbi:uncharacterized protein L199_002104 [Kwoniella botswanensis]|uniref:uncharacterized protein n=1 Tax=Kwoniella botswanensis TaxID=1268659 RepID=UPI00315D52F6